jgi:hypothetical protein
MTLAKDEDNPAAYLGSPAQLDKLDRLRDLNISHLVSVPQVTNPSVTTHIYFLIEVLIFIAYR